MKLWSQIKKIGIGDACLWSSYIYICWLLLSPEMTWVLPEAFHIKSHIMSQSGSGYGWPFIEMWNYQAFEFAPRLTRPLSSLFDIIDTLVRANLWSLFPPHASLSLTYIFSLILTPYLLFRMFLNFGVPAQLAKVGVALFLIHPGQLSLVPMLFRSAKAMVQFFFVAAFVVMSSKDNTKKSVRPWVRQAVMPLLILVACLFDETGVIIYPVVVIFFWADILKKPFQMAMMVAVPAVVGLLYFFIFPYCAVLAGFERPHLMNYSASNGSVFPSFLVFLSGTLMNFRIMAVESLGLFSPELFQEWLLKSWMTLHWAVLIFGVVGGAVVLRKKSPDKKAMRLLKCAVVGFIVAFAVQNTLMHTVGNSVWGPFWYFSTSSISFATLIVFLGHIFKSHKFFYVPVISIMAVLMYTFPHTNYIYKRLHFYPNDPGVIKFMFTNELNRFEFKLGPDFDLTEAKSKCMELQHRSGECVIPKELYWLPVELGWRVGMADLFDFHASDKGLTTYTIQKK